MGYEKLTHNTIDNLFDYLVVGLISCLSLMLAPVLILGWIVVRLLGWWGKRG